MVTKLVNQPLGMGNPFAPTSKQWIVSAIGAGIGLASSLFGGISAAKARREAEKRQRQQEAKENAWYNRRYNQDYVDTAAGQNLVRRAKDFARENWRKAQGAAAVGGGTDAATAMAKEAGNKMMGNTIADIAAADQANKSHVDDMHRQAEMKFAQMDIDRENQRAADITSAAQGASNAIMSVAGAVDQAASLKGASNNSTDVSSTQVPSGEGPAVHTDSAIANADKVLGGGLTTEGMTAEQIAAEKNRMMGM